MMRRPFWIAAVAVLLVLPAAAQEVSLPPPPGVKLEGVPPIPPEIAEGLARYADFSPAQFVSWHPSKRQVVIVTQEASGAQLSAVEAPGRAHAPLAIEGTALASVWARFDPADPNSLVYVKDAGDGSEAYNLYRFDVAAGTSQLITDGKSRNAAPPLSHPVWARQGKWLAYDSTARNGKDRDLYVVQPADPSTAKKLGDFEGIWVPEDWSPDGNSLLVTNFVFSGVESYLWRIDVRSGERKPVSPQGEKAVWENARFSNDGKTIFAMSNRGGGVSRVWRSDAAGVWLPVSAEHDEVLQFEISPDGQMAAMVVDRGSTDVLQVVDLSTRKPRSLPVLPPGLISQDSRLMWRPGTREIAFSFQNPRTPGDVYSVDTSLGTITKWAAGQVSAFDPQTLPPPEVVKWKGFDGLEISGILYRAAAKFTGPRPVMINIHGGPLAASQPIYVGRSNYFLNELGISIIYPNYRGSSHFGPDFAAADDGKKRVGAIKDIGTILDWIATRPDLDKTRVMLTGASYGGYLSLEAGAEYNDRIRCIYEAVGQTNFVTFLEQTDPSRRDDRRHEFGDERDPDMRAFLLSISPVSHAAQLKTPLGIAHAANDTRVPVAQARELIDAVKKNGAPVWYMEYANAGHGDFPRTRADNNFNFACWILFAKMYLLK